MVWRAAFLLWAVVESFVIDPTTTKEDIKRAFHCSNPRWIGSYNEFYQQCEFTNHTDSVHITDTTLDVSAVFLDPGVLTAMDVNSSMSYHIELKFLLHGSSFSMKNSTIVCSALYISSEDATLDAASTINTTAQGLIFGPGFNADSAVGSGYGGTGGASLSRHLIAPPKCDDFDVESAIYFQPIGDLQGSVGDFRGYGSGGGIDSTRGAGLVHLNITKSLHIDGLILANGGFDPSGESRSGSGGTISLRAESILGKGKIEACGGNATMLDDSSGGGGGGGGGRVILDYASKLEKVTVLVNGGKLSHPKPEFWCQQGGGGTFLEVFRSKPDELHGTIWIRGHGHDAPQGLLAGTPLFYHTSRRELMIEPWMTRLHISEQALILASSVQLQGNNSITSIELEAGSSWVTLNFNDTIEIIASNITIGGYVGPIDPHARDKQDIFLTGSNDIILLKEAKLDVHTLTAQTSSAIESKAAVLADRFFRLDGATSVHLHGHIEVDPPRLGRSSQALVRSRGNVVVALDSTSQIMVPFGVQATGDATVNLSFKSASVTIEGKNVMVDGTLTKPLPILGIEPEMCRAWKTHDQVCATSDSASYALSIAAISSVTLTQNIAAASTLICSPKVTIEGSILADSLGCSDGGPGQSRPRHGASGGAGHGGDGGDVMPDKKGAGKSYETSTWPQWPGSSAASDDDSMHGGKGGGLVVIFAPFLNLSSGIVSVRGENGTQGGGGGSGGTIVLGGVGQLAGKGTLDLSGGAGSVFGGPDQEPGTRAIGGGGGGGVLWIHYSTKGSGKDFEGHVILSGGTSEGQTGFDGVGKGDSCGQGCGGLFCLPCRPGTFSPADDECMPCPSGTFSDKSGSTKCTKCTKGTFNPNNGSQACVPCAAGHFAADDGSATCAKCPIGTFSDDKGAAACRECAIGTIAPSEGSSTCQECGIGETTDGPHSISCRKCTGKPEHSTYNKRGSCDYGCDPGRRGLECLTPFELFIKPIGGPLGFVLICFFTVVGVFGIYGYLSYRGSSPNPSRKQYQAVRGPKPHSADTHLPRLTDQQLTFHVARIYFEGLNTFSQPWELPTQLLVDDRLKKTIYEGSYAGFATTCNQICTGHVKAWSTWAWVQRTCRLVLPPLAVWILRRYQRGVVKKLFKYIQEYGTGFYRDLDIRVSGANLILGYSSDYSQGYIDLLLSPDAQRNQVHDSKPLLLFLTAGDGSFLSPFFFDTNDALLRAVPYRVEILRDSVWLDCIATLNQYLRLVTNHGDGLDAVLDHLDTFNASDVLNGYTVEFGMSTSYSDDMTTVDASFVPLNEPQPLPYRSKWALYVTKRRRSSSVRIMSPRISPEPLPQPAPPSIISSIRYEALYAPDETTELSRTPLLSDAERPLVYQESPIWSSLLMPWRHVADAATPYTWLFPYSLLLLLSVDFFCMVAILNDYSCIQVKDPTAPKACSQTAFELLLLCVPAAVIGAPLLGIIFVLQRQSLLGRLFVMWNHVSWINLVGALVSDIVYSASLGDHVLVLIVVVMAVKYMQTNVALYVLAQFEGDRHGRGWKGLFTTQEYYDAAYRRF
ncbi:unnamed protein product [Aphanomyces euteiches]|nr:hypothetical protein AeRB84_011028 [Aphanomyces euteiches]